MATDPNTVRHYNDNAEKYNQHVSDPKDSPFHSLYEKPAIRAELPELSELDVISIGCGSGVDAKWLTDNGAGRVVGIDISSGLIEIARRNHPGIEFHVMDMENLKLDDESFDLAYSSLAIHYVDDWTTSLKEAHRVLRPEGKYVFSCGHPIDSAMQYETIDNIKHARIGRRVNEATNERVVYGDYLGTETGGVISIKATVGDIEVVYYHRTFSKMLEHIIASGFQIERLVEPQPVPKMKEDDPDHFERLTKIPFFMIWVLKKASR